MNQRGCPVCEFWARCGPDGTFDAPHHATCPVPAAAVELLAALKGLLAVIHDSDQREHPSSMRLLSVVSGKAEFAAIDEARAAIAKAGGR